ncbi:MAG TPA: ATP-binding protein [Gemmatimonadaceae bacterium]
MRVARRLQLLALASVASLWITLLVFSDIHAGILTLSAVIAALVSVALATVLARGIDTPLAELHDTLRSLSTGRFSARPPLQLRGELGELATVIHRLAEQLEGQTQSLRGEDTLLSAMMESLSEGVIAVDRGQRVVRINAAARQMLGIVAATPFPVDRLPRQRELQQSLQSAQRGAEPEPLELRYSNKLLLVTARPLRDGGAVVALFDTTRTRRLEMVRRDFVANVSHELRTPLTVITGFAETLVTDDPSAESRRQFLETIRDNAQRMTRIVDDLLDLSRLESGGWVPALTDVSVEAVFDEIITALQPAAEEKGLRITATIAEGAEEITADRVAVSQVLSNLLNNAVRHTEHGEITVSSIAEANGVWLSVADTGPGISHEHLPRIFERFYRVDTGRSRGSGGTGLGLAIVKHLVEAHGGTVRATSEVGKGTTISAFFPERTPSRDGSVPHNVT